MERKCKGSNDDKRWMGRENCNVALSQMNQIERAAKIGTKECLFFLNSPFPSMCNSSLLHLNNNEE